MSNSSQASQRIAALLDRQQFQLKSGAKVTARATDFNMKPTETPSDGVVTGYGVIVAVLCMFTARMHPL